MSKSEFPKVLFYDEPLNIGGIEIPCYVLDDPKRTAVISQRGMTGALNMSRTTRDAGSGITGFLGQKSIKPFVSNDLMLDTKKPVRFQNPRGGGLVYGYEATILADTCFAIDEADRVIGLRDDQKHIAERARTLIKGFAKTGIIAMVWEATGYLNEVNREKLSQILAAYIAPELAKWQARFPEVYYEQIYRLRGWDFSKVKYGQRTSELGNITNQLVYAKLPPGVLDELKARNPAILPGWRRKYRFHQDLTSTGHEHLDFQIRSVVSFARASRTWQEFLRLYHRAFPTPGEMPLFEDVKRIDVRDAFLD
jgi:hypothetical protein